MLEPKKHGRWTRVGPTDIQLYKLPKGVTMNCEIREESRGQDSGDSFTLFIGTNKGVYWVRVSTQKPIQPKEANPAPGLEEFFINELKQQGDDIIAHAETGEMFMAPNYVLKGTR